MICIKVPVSVKMGVATAARLVGGTNTTAAGDGAKHASAAVQIPYYHLFPRARKGPAADQKAADPSE
jgi:hypothetical protein